MSAIEVRPATLARFDDVATLLAPKNPDSAVCWCLTYRLSPKENRELGAQERPEAELIVDLPSQTVRTSDDAWARHFDIDPFKKYRLLRGLDDIAMTIAYEPDVAAFEARRPAFLPTITLA